MISVCMATYNGERFLQEQIDSILCQLNPEDELIISDDGSTDGTLEIIASYQDSRIKLLHHKKKPEYEKIKYSRNFYYATDNFENALTAAQGDYIFLADQDDVWMENKVDECLKALSTWDCVVHNMEIVDITNNPLSLTRYTTNPVPSSWFGILWKMRLWGCCLCFRKSVLSEILPFPQKLIAHDYWICAIVLKKINLGYVSLPLIRYREHQDSTSYMVQNPLHYKIQYRIILFFQILFHKSSLTRFP